MRYYKKVRYARFVPFYIVIWAAFSALFGLLATLFLSLHISEIAS